MPTTSSVGVSFILLSKVDDIEIDLLGDSTVTHDSLVTQNPTETGANISDHVVNLPVVITLSGRFVDAPLAGFGGTAAFFNPLQAASTLAATGPNRSQSKWQALEALRASKKVIEVFIQQNLYKNMVIKTLTGPRTKGDGGSQQFKIELQEIITTSTEQSTTATPAESVEHSAAPSENAGVMGTEEWATGAEGVV